MKPPHTITKTVTTVLSPSGPDGVKQCGDDDVPRGSGGVPHQQSDAATDRLQTDFPPALRTLLQQRESLRLLG